MARRIGIGEHPPSPAPASKRAPYPELAEQPHGSEPRDFARASQTSFFASDVQSALRTANEFAGNGNNVAAGDVMVAFARCHGSDAELEFEDEPVSLEIRHPGIPTAQQVFPCGGEDGQQFGFVAYSRHIFLRESEEDDYSSAINWLTFKDSPGYLKNRLKIVEKDRQRLRITSTWLAGMILVWAGQTIWNFFTEVLPLLN